MVNLEQTKSRIPDAWSVKLTFPLRVTFYFTKTEKKNKLKDIYLSSHITASSKGTILDKKG